MMQQTDAAEQTAVEIADRLDPIALALAIVDGHLELRREIRRRARVHDRCSHPVVVVAGDEAPRGRGDGWHYRTRGGTVIDHPSAYAARGWSNMVYVRSTRRIEVGVEWLADHLRGCTGRDVFDGRRGCPSPKHLHLRSDEPDALEARPR